MSSAFDFCLPTRSTMVPSGPDWLHEVKYDGYRLRLERDGDRVRLVTRGGYDWTVSLRRRPPCVVREAGRGFDLKSSFKVTWRMQVNVLGAERRRRWSYDEKVRLVEESLQAGETVCGVARRHGVAHSLLFTWRRQARQGRLGGDSVPALVPVEITPVAP